jgi:hypothetical protein
MKIIALLATVALLAGCAPQVLQSTPTQSYQVGQRIQASPGGVILSAQHGSINTVKRWVGILNSPDGWKTTTERSSDYLRKELLYSGLSGTTIEIGYREFRGDLAAPAFYQSAKYDLSSSREISFQNFRFRVDTADNNGMTGVLLSDGMSSAAGSGFSSGGTIPRQVGPSTMQAEKVAKDAQCHTAPVAEFLGRGPGFESYAVPCANGDQLMIRCEFGNCRALR